MKKHKRALSLLLIICIMCCVFFGSLESANAFVLNPWTIALCGSLLVAAGLTFNSASQMEVAAGSFLDSLPAGIRADLEAQGDLYKQSTEGGFFLSLGAELIAAISGWLSGVTATGGGSVSLGNMVSYNISSFPEGASTIIATFPISNFIIDKPLKDDVSYSFMGCNLLGFYMYQSGSSYSPCFTYLKSDGSYGLAYQSNLDVSVDSVDLKIIRPSGVSFFTISYQIGKYFVERNFNYSDFSSFSVLDGVATIPFDSTWAPDSEDESKALVPGASVKLPKGLVQDGALDSDVIGAMTPESVRAGTSDIPDVIAGTGTITGTGEGTGIFEGIGSLVLNIPFVGTIASTLSGILEAIRGFFDVSKFDLNFDSLKIGLTKVFPFCIPFDFFNAIKMFSSDASAFVFDINLETEYFTIDHTVDLTPFRLPILFFRYVVVFWFGFILISRTKDFMKW